jgi:hypothetical protein
MHGVKLVVRIPPDFITRCLSKCAGGWRGAILAPLEVTHPWWMFLPGPVQYPNVEDAPHLLLDRLIRECGGRAVTCLTENEERGNGFAAMIVLGCCVK